MQRVLDSITLKLPRKQHVCYSEAQKDSPGRTGPQLRPSACRKRLPSQPHLYPPPRLVQVCSQPPLFTAHSFTSAHQKLCYSSYSIVLQIFGLTKTCLGSKGVIVATSAATLIRSWSVGASVTAIICLITFIVICEEK